LRRVEAHLHRIEVELAFACDHDLPVERRVGREQLADRAQLGEVAEERAAVARTERQLPVVVFKHAAEAVPLRLVAPAALLRQLRDELGLHRREGNVATWCVGHGCASLAAMSRLAVALLLVVFGSGCGGSHDSAEPQNALLTGVKVEATSVTFEFKSKPQRITSGYQPRSRIAES